MKIGITLNDYFKDILQESANLNNLSCSTICGLIVENFLSFNKDKGRIPLFRQYVQVKFAQKTTSQKVNEKFEKDQLVDVPEPENDLDWDQMVAYLESENDKYGR